MAACCVDITHGVSVCCSLEKMLEALSKLKHLYELTNQYKHLYEVSAMMDQYCNAQHVYPLQVAAIEVAVHLHQGDLSAATDSYNTAATCVSVPHIDKTDSVIPLSLSLAGCMGFPAQMPPLSWRGYCRRTESVTRSCSTSAVMTYSSGHWTMKQVDLL